MRLGILSFAASDQPVTMASGALLSHREAKHEKYEVTLYFEFESE